MSQTSRSVGSSVQGQQRVLGFSGPLPCPWLWCMTRRGRKSRFCSVCVMGIIYFWQCCLFVFDFRPLTSFLLSNWVCACPCGAPAAVVAGAPGPRLRPSCAHLLPAGSTALLLLLWTSFWPSWPWSWSVPWRACLCTQVSMTRSLLMLRKVFNCSCIPTWSLARLPFWQESFSTWLRPYWAPMSLIADHIQTPLISNH